ncbi:hypothetical protein [Absidia glauca]|uniref:Uncharacterized protein n=1 Tax=Absidia glauca TaxID=4829 RepID=A0A168KXB3_ABSGL|nr:hypothetical protein [Absidia glauca]
MDMADLAKPQVIRSHAYRTGRNKGSFILDVSSRKEGDSTINSLIPKQYSACRGAANFREGGRRLYEVNIALVMVLNPMNSPPLVSPSSSLMNLRLASLIHSPYMARSWMLASILKLPLVCLWAPVMQSWKSRKIPTFHLSRLSPKSSHGLVLTMDSSPPGTVCRNTASTVIKMAMCAPTVPLPVLSASVSRAINLVILSPTVASLTAPPLVVVVRVLSQMSGFIP